MLLGQKIGQTGYIYVLDSAGVVKIHPKPDVIGQKLAEIGFIQKQVTQKNGYLEYWWKNPQESEPRAKALHMTYFEPWDWIISVSSYKSEFVQSCLGGRFSRRTYWHRISSAQGIRLFLTAEPISSYHPKLTGNMMDYATNENKEQIRKIIEQKKGMLRYFWKNPDDQSLKEKLMVF